MTVYSEGMRIDELLRHDLAAQQVPVSALTPWKRNPRKNDEAAKRLASAIGRFGWTTPLLAQKSSGKVIAGHTRLKAAKILGLDVVPVAYLDVNNADAKAIAIADNRLGELAEWDDEGLEALLRELRDGGEDLAFLGYDDDDLSGILDDPEPPPAPSDAPDVQQGPPDSVQGEVYELGPHRLVCGDCRDPRVVAELLDGVKVNVAFTSPPYASQRKYDESSGFKPIPPDEYVEWFDAVQANVREHLADDGSWFVNIKPGSESGSRLLYVADLLTNHVREWGWRFIDEFCWLRQALPGSPESMGKFKNAFEPVYHFAGKGLAFFPRAVRHESAEAFKYEDQKAAGRNISAASQGLGNNAQSPVGQGAGLAYPSNVLDFKQGAGVTGHSAAFPLALPVFFIKAFSTEGDAVLDPFLGSGTTLIAAAQHGRVAFGCEISPAYCDVIRRRWTRYAVEHGIDPGPGALDG